VVFLPHAVTAPIKCRNGTVAEIHLGRGSQKFHLSPGCQADFEQHLVFSDLTIKLPADIIHYEWEWEPLDLIQMPVAEVSTELAKLREFGLHRPRLTDLQYMSVQDSRGRVGSIAHIFHTVGNIILALLIIAIIIAIGYKCYVWRRSKRSPGPVIRREQPRADRANDPEIRALAASLLFGQNTPPRNRVSQSRHSFALGDQPVHYGVRNQQVHFGQHPHEEISEQVHREIEKDILVSRLTQLHHQQSLAASSPPQEHDDH
jgi:hypothetical protein